MNLRFATIMLEGVKIFCFLSGIYFPNLTVFADICSFHLKLGIVRSKVISFIRLLFLSGVTEWIFRRIVVNTAFMFVLYEKGKHVLYEGRCNWFQRLVLCFLYHRYRLQSDANESCPFPDSIFP